MTPPTTTSAPSSTPGPETPGTPGAPPSIETNTPKRVLGPIDATCIVVGAIIGVGIFFTPTQVAKIAGSGELALLAWGVGGLIAMLGALTFAQLGRLYPRTGGQYHALRDAYGPMTGFVYVICNATFIQAGAIGIIAIICANYLCTAFGRSDPSTLVVLVIATVMIGGLSIANIRGVRWGARIQNFTVLMKVLTLIVVTAIAILWAPDNTATLAQESVTTDLAASAIAPTGMTATMGVVFAALVPAFFAFGGWQQALWVAGEVRRPHRNLPLAIIGGVMLVVIVYLLANWAYLHLLGFEGVIQSDAIAADAVGIAWPDAGKSGIAIAVAISAFGVLNAQLLAGPRLIAGLAGDGRFFRMFARFDSKLQTPVAAITLLAAMALFLLYSAYAIFGDGRNAIDKLLTGVVVIDALFFALTGLALIVLRRRRSNGDQQRRRRAWATSLIAALFVLGLIGMLIGSIAQQENKLLMLFAAGWIIAAAVMYKLFFARGIEQSSEA